MLTEGRTATRGEGLVPVESADERLVELGVRRHALSASVPDTDTARHHRGAATRPASGGTRGKHAACDLFEVR